MRIFRALLTLAFLALSLSGCEATSKTEPAFSIPSSCELPEVISAFQERIQGAEFVPTDWEPAVGTELKEIYDLGGLACTYGIQSAEIGGTIMWAEVSDDFWNQKRDQWLSQGFITADVSNLDESEAFIATLPSADGNSSLVINLKINAFWIQFGASKFVEGLPDAEGIVIAAASALAPKD